MKGEGELSENGQWVLRVGFLQLSYKTCPRWRPFCLLPKDANPRSWIGASGVVGVD